MKRTAARVDRPLPTVTLVVAMRNEASSLEACLASIAAQDYPADRLEVFIADGHSTDASRAIAEESVGRHPSWRIGANERSIAAAGWNAGISAARGEIVGIVSAHAELASDYVRRAVEALQSTGADMVGGPVCATGDGPIGVAAAIATQTRFGVGNAPHHLTSKTVEVDTVFMGVAQRDVWRRFPFDESMVRNEDDELSYRLLDHGGRIVCDPSIRSVYRARDSVAGLWRQYFEYGRWKVPVMQAHPRQIRFRHVVPLASIGVETALAVAATRTRRAAKAAALLAITYAASLATVALRHGGRQPSVVLGLLVVYPVMHVAYGVGMARGLIQFRRGWRRTSTTASRRAAGRPVADTRAADRVDGSSPSPRPQGAYIDPPAGAETAGSSGPRRV